MSAEVVRDNGAIRIEEKDALIDVLHHRFIMVVDDKIQGFGFIHIMHDDVIDFAGVLTEYLFTGFSIVGEFL